MSRRKRLLLVGLLTVLVSVVMGAHWLRFVAKHACDHAPDDRELSWLASDPSRAARHLRALELRVRCDPRAVYQAYGLAAAQLDAGRPGEALAALETVVARGYDNPDDLGSDPTFAPLRDEPRFAEVMARARTNEAQGFGPIDPTAPLPGLRTFEGRPDGGLRYRLRVPESASTERPARVIAWLHPSGSLFNEVEGLLAPRAGRLGHAFLVPTQKVDVVAWWERDAKRFLGPSLAEAQTRPGVSSERPVVLGFSAGGQIALTLWNERPERFGALILVAAYPVEADVETDGYRPTPLPKSPAIRDVPIYVLVGEEDGLVHIWREAFDGWRDAGVPLTVRYVPRAGHDWLVGDEELEELLRWLAALPGARDGGR